jgi:hypothetical protein
LKRRIRRAIEIGMPLLGMLVIFGSVLFGPSSLQAQVLMVLSGILILEAGVWGLTNGLLPNERRYLALREEGDHFLGLIRTLNSAAVARDLGEESDERFRDTRAQMHSSVERMAELAGKDAFAELEAAVIEAAETTLAEAKTAVDEAAAAETPAEPAGRELSLGEARRIELG